MWQGLMYKHWKARPAGGLVQFCGVPGNFQGVWGLWGLLLETNMGLSQAEGDGAASPSWVWSSSSLRWGHPARAFLSRNHFWQRNLGPDWRSQNWVLSLSFPVPLLRGAPDGFCIQSCRLDSPFLTSPC